MKTFVAVTTADKTAADELRKKLANWYASRGATEATLAKADTGKKIDRKANEVRAKLFADLSNELTELTLLDANAAKKSEPGFYL